jgi:hypothetical protein
MAAGARAYDAGMKRTAAALVVAACWLRLSPAFRLTEEAFE